MYGAILFLSVLSLGSAHHPINGTFVHLFEWRWDDIAKECEEFLGPHGYLGIQVSPANENGIIWDPTRPWFERYQPVSYDTTTRSGGDHAFRQMVQRCNRAGVRIYVDAVINHMTGALSGHGTGGSPFNYDQLDYPRVPYRREHFNSYDKCGTGSGNIEDYNNLYQVRNCRLLGLADLDQSQEHVKNKIVDYMNHLISMGVAGFRIDAAKHMWPDDLKAIMDRLSDLHIGYFPPGTRPFIFQEVIDMGGEPIKSTEYIHIGKVTEFKYGLHLGDVIRKNHQLLKYLWNFGQGWGFLHDEDAVVFIDNHDNQRGHGAGGFNRILTFFESRMYKMANAFMLAWPYGRPKVMSSYRWPRNIEGDRDTNDWIGPPHDEDFNTLPVERNEDLTCGNGWVCEHRWRQIYNMVRFRAVAGTEPVSNWWDNGFHQIAFGRGNKGFLAINNEDHQLNVRLQTGMSPGRYCDVISGNKKDGGCTGKIIEVGDDGNAQIVVDNTWEDPMIAFHVDSKL